MRHELDPFREGLLHLLKERRHLVARLQARHRDLLGAQAPSAHGHVHGDAAAADHEPRGPGTRRSPSATP